MKYPKGVKAGPLAWMTSNAVAANLLMVMLIAGGLLMMPRIKQEVFPEANADIITISMAYPGASPEEVEEGIVMAIEEAVQGLDGVKEVTSTASEGVGSVVVELLTGHDHDDALADVRTAVDRITSFPEEVERPDIAIMSNRSRAIALVIHGNLEELTLRELAEEARADLLQNHNITLVEIDGVRPLEISIEISQSNLRRYGVTLEQVAQAVRRSSIDLPSGGIRTDGGEVLLRLSERREIGSEFEEIIVLSRPDGTAVSLADIAIVDDGFRENDQETYFNGERAVRVNVFRVGNQTPIEVSEAVHDYMADRAENLAPGVSMAIWADTSEMYRGRIGLLLKNGYLGLTLVLLILGLFLEIRLAFWVTLGIPISFLGAMLLMPSMGVSLNMISLFAFILTLGIVVDDAIVVGEAVYKHRQDGKKPVHAAIDGVREVAMPVVFSILTTIVGFMPMLFVPGFMGKFFRVIPLITIAVLLISLVESLFILPAHLAHSKGARSTGFLGFIHKMQQGFSRAVERHVDKFYLPIVKKAVAYRYLTLAIAFASLFVTFGVIKGRLDWSFMPKIESDVILVPLAMPFGTPVEETREMHDRLVETAVETFGELGSQIDHSRGILAQVGSSGEFAFGVGRGFGQSASHLAQVSVFLVPAEERDFTAAEFVQVWRERVGEVPGVESIRYRYTTGPGSRDSIQLQLSHNDMGTLEQAAESMTDQINEFEGVMYADDGFSLGKEQLDIRLRPHARALGLSEVELARQLRSSFFGSEAVRLQRGRDELRVYVRLPDDERRSEYDLESLMVRTSQGGEIPLRAAAEVTRGRAFTSINRRQGRRILTIAVGLDDEVTNATKVIASVERDVLPELIANTPGLSYDFVGRQQEQRETMGSLRRGGLLALLGMFALMAIAFRSYLQPAIIMTTIPFGIVGATIGHIVMGYDLSLMSVLGMVALSGIVVNDSLILIAATNKFRENGMSRFEAVAAGGARRFRPIVLTSLTTFFGLAPMIIETSVQARFLVPMAISLGFGVLFATAITLLVVPAIYMIIEDIRTSFEIVKQFVDSDGELVSHPATAAAEGDSEA